MSIQQKRIQIKQKVKEKVKKGFDFLENKTDSLYKFFNLIYLKYKISDKQSFGYQIALILMNEHYLSRRGLNSIGDSIGDDTLVIRLTKENSEFLMTYIYINVTENYKKSLEEGVHSFDDFEKLIIALLSDIKYCELKKEEIKQEDDTIIENQLIFKMKQEGYRYQYNGYVQKDFKLQEFANVIATIVIFGTIFNWLLDKGYINLKRDFLAIISFIFFYVISYIFRHKDWIIRSIIIAIGIYIGLLIL